MSSILAILTEDSRRLVIDQFPFLRTDFKTCWYPSCGADFRHVRYLENDRLSKGVDSDAMLYVHSDMIPRTSISDADEEGLDTPFFAGQSIGEDLEVQDCFEIYANENFFRPSHEVWNMGHGNGFTGRVFFLLIRYTHGPNREEVQVPLVFFGYENLNLFVDCFLANRIPIHTLVHIKDGGGSFGGSNFRMNFIYQAAEFLNIRRVLSDFTRNRVSSFVIGLNSRFDREVLINRCMENPRAQYVSGAIRNEDSEQYFLDHYWDKRVSWTIYGEAEGGNFVYFGNDWHEIDYYDWTRVSPDVFQESIEIARTQKPPDLLARILEFPRTPDPIRSEIFNLLFDLVREGSDEARLILFYQGWHPRKWDDENFDRKCLALRWKMARDGSRFAVAQLEELIGSDDGRYLALLWRLFRKGFEFAAARLAELVGPDNRRYQAMLWRLSRNGFEFAGRRLAELVGPDNRRYQAVLWRLSRNGCEFAVARLSELVEPQDQDFLSILWKFASLGNRTAIDTLGKLVDADDSRFIEILDIADGISLKLPSIERKRKFLAWKELMIRRSKLRADREELLAKLMIVPPIERLTFVAADIKHPVNYFPVDWAEISDSELDLLNMRSIIQLKEKLKYAKPGPWRLLNERLSTQSEK